jgi:hypothetical protein
VENQQQRPFPKKARKQETALTEKQIEKEKQDSTARQEQRGKCNFCTEGL